jgi:8-hydroxy-5-deazaflavin:NADPH oxidoreductase
MRFGVLGTGMVGQTIAGKLVSLGHETMMGSRSAGNEKATAWADGAGELGLEGSFSDAARHGEILVNATAGAASLEALDAAGVSNLDGKILIDIANPLDFSGGMPPTFTVANTDSLGEQIQRAFPGALVVKALNTVTAAVMVDPTIVPGTHNAFICGNDASAKETVSGLLESFGWPRSAVIDIGDISGSRAVEMYLALWLRLMQKTGTPMLNVELRVAHGA